MCVAERGRERGLLQDLHTKGMADAGAELITKLDLPGIGLLQNVHTKGMAREAAEVETSEAYSQRSNEQAQNDGHWKEALTSNIASTRAVLEENTAKFESMTVPSEDTYRGGMRQVACPFCGCPTTCVEDDSCDECGGYSHIRECAACAWYACIRCTKAAQEARLPREARRRRGRGRHRW